MHTPSLPYLRPLAMRVRGTMCACQACCCLWGGTLTMLLCMRRLGEQCLDSELTEAGRVDLDTARHSGFGSSAMPA